MNGEFKMYGEVCAIGKETYIVCNWFNQATRKCVLCGKGAVAMIDQRVVCSKECAKELVYDEFEKFMDGITK